jgi:uncharacterized protein YegL
MDTQGPTEFFSTKVEYSQVSAAYSGSQYVMASLRAPKFEPTEGKRSRLRLVAVLDRSGSMQSDNKMTLVKETMSFLAQRVLRAEDELAIVAYDNEVEVPLPLTVTDAAGCEKALAAVKGLSPRGSTNLSGGLFKGLELVQGATDKDVTAVLLFTDGLANQGLQDSAAIKTITEQMCSGSAQPPSVFTFGFGKDHNEDMLRVIAEAAKGTYYFVKGKDDIPQAFGDCFGGLVSVVAQNIKLKFEPGAPGVVISKVHAPSEAKATTGGGLEVSLGDLYSEEHRDILCEIQLPQVAASTEQMPVVRCTCTCINITTAQSEMHKNVAVIARPEQAPNNGPDVEIDQHRNRIDVVAAIEAATKAADHGDLEQGRTALVKARERLLASVSAETDACRGLLRDIDQILAGMQERAQYMRYTSKMSKARMMSHAQQRCNYSNYASEEGMFDQESEMYQTSSKVRMKKSMMR